MRVIYRSASKSRLSPSTPSPIRDVLDRLLLLFRSFFSWLVDVRSALCRFYLQGLAWLALSTFLLPWVGPLFLVLWLWRSWAVPWLFRRLSYPGDRLETSLKLRGFASGLNHMALKFEGPPNLNTIRERLDGILQRRSLEADGWKLKRSLVRLAFDTWAWREIERFDLHDHVTLCEEGLPLNCKTLKYKVNELCGVPLDPRHSPWHVHVVPFVNRETRSPCHALLVRSHHLIAHLFRPQDFCSYDPEKSHLRDALVYALSQNGAEGCCETNAKPDADLPPKILTRKERLSSVLHLVWKAPSVLIIDAANCIRSLIKSMRHNYKRALSWSDPISKDLVCRLKEASKADSVETVLLSCLSGALHHYRLVSGNPEDQGDSIRALVPRGNGHLRITMSVRENCARTRLRKIQTSLKKSKSDVRFELSRLAASVWAKVLPSSVASYLAGLFYLRYPAIVDSLHVPTSDSSIAEVNYWKLAPVDVGLSVSFVHYGENVSLSVVSDFDTLQRPDLLASCFSRAVLDLALAYNVRYERKPSPPSTPTKSFSGL